MTPAALSVRVAARLRARPGRAADEREFWLILAQGRRAFAAGRRDAGQRSLVAIRYRLAQAVARQDEAWIARLRHAERELEAL